MGWLKDNMPVIGQGAGAASTILGMISSIGQGKRELKRKKEMADYEQQLAMQMYDKQFADQKALIADERAYNDFGSVVSRARAAGVNPVYALGGSGGVGISSSSTTTPSASSGSMSSSVYDPSSSLITAGSTLSSQAQQFGLYQATLEKAEADAKKAKVEADWKEREIIADVDKKEAYTELTRAQIGTETERKRLVTAQAKMQEIMNESQGKLNQMQLDQMQEQLRLFREQADNMEIKNEYQAQILQAQISEYEAAVYATYQDVAQKWKELEQNADKLNLSKAELEEVKRANKVMEGLKKDQQEHDQKMDKKRFTKDVVLGSVNSACNVAGAVAKFINPLSAIAKSRPALADSWTDSGYIFAD